MTGDRDPIHEQVRLAVEALPDEPIRWDRVSRRVRRRRLLTLVALLFAGVAITLVVATGFLAGKSAIDPSFSPPLVSRNDLSIDFDEPALGHGLTPLSSFGSALAARGKREGDDLEALGYVFHVSLSGSVDKLRGLPVHWDIRHRGDPEALPLKIIPDVKHVSAGDKSSTDFGVWIERPSRAGQYVVDFSLMATAGVVAHETSVPLHVVTRGLLRHYMAPTYVAGVPRGWRIESDYKPEPGHRFVTRLKGSDGMSVLIDTTLETSGDPADSAGNLEGFIEGGSEPYRRLSFARRNLSGPAFEWCFELGEHFSTDIFFYRAGNGYAVLAEGPQSRFREARSVARAVVRSLRGRGHPGST